MKIIMAIGLLIMLNCCAGYQQKADNRDSGKVFQSLSAENAEKLIRNGREHGTIRIIDIRTPGEFSKGHIENSINIDYYSPDFKKKIEALGRIGTYLIYCLSGRRSGMAMEIFRELGFNEVYDIAGGFKAWSDAGYPVVK